MAAIVADRHPPFERRLFAFINDHADEPRLLRVVQQLGTPWVLPITAAGAALAGRPRLGAAAALSLPAEKALEVGLKKVRPTARPLYVQPTVLRDDAPMEGESFPSGHAAIAFTAAGLVAPHASAPVALTLYALAAGTALVRISQGAHHPIDALAGAALGIALAGGLNLAVGRDDTSQ